MFACGTGTQSIRVCMKNFGLKSATGRNRFDRVGRGCKFGQTGRKRMAKGLHVECSDVWHNSIIVSRRVFVSFAIYSLMLAQPKPGNYGTRRMQSTTYRTMCLCTTQQRTFINKASSEVSRKTTAATPPTTATTAKANGQMKNCAEVAVHNWN